jgi:hypothetical protein
LSIGTIAVSIGTRLSNLELARAAGIARLRARARIRIIDVGDVTGAQTPGLAAVLHAWQVPQLALSQQTPSTQLPVSQSLVSEHAVPCE